MGCCPILIQSPDGPFAVSLTLQSEAPPLRQDEGGAFRVGESRVLLEIVMHEFQDGATPEAIVQDFPTLRLADIYAVIAYALRRPEEIEDYLAGCEREAEEVRRRIEAAQGDLGDIRRRLLARRAPEAGP
jgi:uncharacterized protein (DUF433 family)